MYTRITLSKKSDLHALEIVPAHFSHHQVTAGKVMFQFRRPLSGAESNRLQINMGACFAPATTQLLDRRVLVCTDVSCFAAGAELAVLMGLVSEADVEKLRQFVEYLKPLVAVTRPLSIDTGFQLSLMESLAASHVREITEAVSGSDWQTVVMLLRLAFCPAYKDIQQATEAVLHGNHLPESLASVIAKLRRICAGDLCVDIPGQTIKKLQVVRQLRENVIDDCLCLLLQKFNDLEDASKLRLILNLAVYREQRRLVSPLCDIDEMGDRMLLYSGYFHAPASIAKGAMWAKPLDKMLSYAFRLMGVSTADGRHNFRRLTEMHNLFESPVLARYINQISQRPVFNHKLPAPDEMAYHASRKNHSH